MEKTEFLTKIKNTLDNLWGGFSDLTGGTLYDVTHRENPLKVAPPASTQAPSQKDQAPLSNPEPTVAPGTDQAMQFLSRQIPQGTTPQQYFPVLGNQDFMSAVQEQDKARQGLANLLLLQAFFESTLGRATNGNNLFGAMPQGEGGQSATFNSPIDSLNYQMSPNVLGGGSNPNMNILGSTAPLRPTDIETLYRSYNPSGDYLPMLLQALFPQQQ